MGAVDAMMRLPGEFRGRAGDLLRIPVLPDKQAFYSRSRPQSRPSPATCELVLYLDPHFKVQGTNPDLFELQRPGGVAAVQPDTRNGTTRWIQA